MRYSCLFLFGFCFVFMQSAAQNAVQLGLLPRVNINTKLPKDWSVNASLEMRQRLWQDDFSHRFILNDLALAADKKINIHSKLAAGFLLRFDAEDGALNYRTFQQFTTIQRLAKVKLGHRLATDQTMQGEAQATFRLRYRLAAEIPLRGETLDPREWYIKLSNEYLGITQGKDADLEIRGVSFIGFVLSEQNKIEWGLDYRLKSLLSDRLRHQFWFGFTFYQSIRKQNPDG